MRTPPEVEKAAAALDDRRPIDRELSDLRREVVEARNLVIKTDNLLKNLHAELKVVSKRHDEQYRRTWFASGVAYALFLVLAAAVATLGARASVSSERAAVREAQAQADAAKKTADDASAQLARLRTEQDQLRVAREQAAQAYKLMSEGQGEARLKGIDALANVDRSRLGPLEQKALDERARALRSELGEAAYERGRNLYRRNDFKGAAAELRRYLTLDPDGSEALNASFYLGAALHQLKEWAAAAEQLDRFTGSKARMKNMDYALLLLGQCYEQLGKHDQAVAAYRRGVDQYPSSEFIDQLQQRFRAAGRAANAASAGASADGASASGASASGASGQPPAAAPKPSTPAPVPTSASAPANAGSGGSGAR